MTRTKSDVLLKFDVISQRCDIMISFHLWIPPRSVLVQKKCRFIGFHPKFWQKLISWSFWTPLKEVSTNVWLWDDKLPRRSPWVLLATGHLKCINCLEDTTDRIIPDGIDRDLRLSNIQYPIDGVSNMRWCIL